MIATGGGRLMEISFAVGSISGPRSSVWSLRADPKGDVYAGPAGTVADVKYSLHKSGICRKAIVKERAEASGLEGDRVIERWKRLTPGNPQYPEAVRPLLLQFATNHLSTTNTLPVRPDTWIPAAPSGYATIVEFIFTARLPAEVARAFETAGQRKALVIWRLRQETFVLAHGDTVCPDEELLFPAEGTSPTDRLFSPSDPHGTGRPLRLNVDHFTPDREVLCISELGGFDVQKGSISRSVPTITARRVIALKRDGQVVVTSPLPGP